MEQTKEIKAYLKFQFKLRVLRFAEEYGKVNKTCELFNISKTSFYKWKKRYEEHGEEGPMRKKRDPDSYANSINPNTVKLILNLRREHKLGTWRIKWYLERYHNINVSESTVFRTLKRHNEKPLHRSVTRKAMGPIRYSKEVPGHHVQVDVKFLNFILSDGSTVKRYQYTAIDDCTRIRALKCYEKHNQQSSIDFINYVVERFPFRIHTIQTDNGHEFQSKFNWHVQDLGIQHNGKVERSHLTDKREFYQLLKYTDDVDLNKKLKQWEDFYNFSRPHGSYKGKTPYEALMYHLKK